MSTKTYSNPRMRAVIPDWPDSGRRVTATFEIETVEGRGQRAVRTTTGKPKKLTYATRMRIVDGSDGQTYIAEQHGSYVQIRQGNMKYSEDLIWSHSPRYAELQALFQTEL
jgi:hypothetical protein